MNTVATTGAGPAYDRPHVVKQQPPVADLHREQVRKEVNTGESAAVQALREQARSPVVKGQGAVIDIEA